MSMGVVQLGHFTAKKTTFIADTLHFVPDVNVLHFVPDVNVAVPVLGIL